MMKKLVQVCLLFFLSVSHADVVCENAVSQGDYNQALSICEKQLIINQEGRVEIWFYLVDINHKLGKYKEEKAYLSLIKNSSEFKQNLVYQYRWHRMMGKKLYSSTDYINATEYFQKALVIAIDQGNEAWMSTSYNDVGLVAYKSNENTLALTYFKQSLALKLKAGNAYKIGNTLNNIALAHMDLEELELAIDYYEQALNQYLIYAQQDESDDRVYASISHIYEDLTKAYAENGDAEKAQLYAQNILATFKSKTSPKAQARALINIGNYYLSVEEFVDAQFFYEEAKAIFDLNGLQFEAHFYLNAAKIYFKKNQVKRAKELAKIGLELSESSNDHNEKSQFYALLSELYQTTDLRKSYDYLVKHKESRELFLQEKYDTDLNTVKHEIQNQKIKHDLVNEQLINAKKTAELQRLTSTILLGVILILILSALFLIYFIQKRKERSALLQSIKHHEQQLFLMQNENLSVQTEGDSDSADNLKHEFKLSLVSTMVDVLAIWEKTTQTDRIELAEQSKAWTISIDNGTLRTRSLDKYLDAEKIPANPRWRHVVKTCHFILTQDALSSEDRIYMEQKLAALLNQVKQLSLGVV